MNNKKLAIILGLFAAGLSTQTILADEGDAPIRFEIPVQALLTPALGFEEKNDIQAVLYGALPNTCYSLGDYTTERLDDHTIRVRQFAFRETGGICADEASMPVHMKMLVPFMQEVSVGHLAAGEYHFVFNKVGTGNSYRSMNVAKNVTPTIDSLPYAAVSAIQTPDVVNGDEHVVVNLSGILNSTCTVLDDEVKLMRQDDVLVLLPTIKVRHNVICAQVLVPFEKRVDVGALEPGIHLIHTRSMNGKAINKVINVMK